MKRCSRTASRYEDCRLWADLSASFIVMLPICYSTVSCDQPSLPNRTANTTGADAVSGKSPERCRGSSHARLV